MGSCLSKEVLEAGTKGHEVNGKSRFKPTAQRLGSSDEKHVMAAPGSQAQTKKEVAQTRPASVGQRLGSKSEAEGSKPGSQGSSDTTREAVARAAELRYNKLQEKDRDSQAKLKAMAKKSRLEKGLAP